MIASLLQGDQQHPALDAYVDSKLHAARKDDHRHNRWLLAVLGAAVVAVLVLVVWSFRSQAAIERMRRDIAKVNKGSGKPPDANIGRALYQKYKKGIFMLVANGRGFCTAFAVRPSVLATNAHCAHAADRLRDVVALENEGRARVSFNVVRVKPHPSFRNNPQVMSPDVGIVHISGKVGTVLALATSEELKTLGPGDDLYLVGFPGRLMDAQNPAATFLAAHVGRVSNSRGQPASFAQTWLVEHDAQTTEGTSGSPVFDSRGKVVAINAGSYAQADDREGGSRTSPYKYAMRIDLLNSLLSR